MSTTRPTETHEPPAPEWAMVPWPGAAVALGAVVVMVTASAVAWPDMAVEIVTREANGRHGESTAGRGFTALALPVLLLMMTALLAVTPRLGYQMLSGVPGARGQDPASARRVFSWTLMGLSVLLVVLHLGLLSMFTGSPFPLDQAAATAVGMLLVCVGIAVPLAAPGGHLGTGWLERFRAGQGALYRKAGIALVLVGVATTLAALIDPTLAMVVAAASIVVVFVALLVVATIRASRGSADD